VCVPVGLGLPVGEVLEVGGSPVGEVVPPVGGLEDVWFGLVDGAAVGGWVLEEVGGAAGGRLAGTDGSVGQVVTLGAGRTAAGGAADGAGLLVFSRPK